MMENLKEVFNRKKHIFIQGMLLCLLGTFLALGLWWRQKTAVQSAKRQETEENTEKKDNIKWVEFDVTCEALYQAYRYDLETHETERPLGWVDLLAYLGAKYGGDFSRFRQSDMEDIAEQLQAGTTTIEKLSAEMKYFAYYREAYGAVLDGLVGEYRTEAQTDGGVKWEKRYGLKAFHPIAKGFPYSDYDDFGASRSYGYKRVHLGHDMMGQVGTPIIAVESGYVSAMGWNQYGGWRLGISSFDGKRYYYYAHLRQNFPYSKSLQEGSVVQAGDVIGYMGHTGYSTKENVNNIDTTHLHFGLQLIFDESQREGIHEIWVDVYPLVRFLYQNQSETRREDASKEWVRISRIKDPEAEKYQLLTNRGKKVIVTE